jgi:tetrahydromethanopterin S-methyltransferase subunit B
MGKWSTILRAGKFVASPARNLAATGTALKSATLGAGAAYVGWQALVNDKPVVRTMADVAIGEKNVDTIVGKTSDIADSTGEALSSVNHSATSANNIFSGLSDFMRNASSGEGGNMFANLFTNLFNGNVSGLSIVGLLAAGLMIFSHTGWLGKIGGALLAMALIGSNSKRVMAPQVSTGVTPETQQSSGLRR